MNNFYSQDSSRRWTLERINDAAKVEPEYLINSVESHLDHSPKAEHRTVILCPMTQKFQS